MVTALNTPEISQKLIKSGAQPAPGTPAQLADHLKSEIARWGKIIKEKGIKPEN